MMTDEGSVTIPLIDCELGLLGQGNVLLAEWLQKANVEITGRHCTLYVD